MCMNSNFNTPQYSIQMNGLVVVIMTRDVTLLSIWQYDKCPDVVMDMWWFQTIGFWGKEKQSDGKWELQLPDSACLHRSSRRARVTKSFRLQVIEPVFKI